MLRTIIVDPGHDAFGIGPLAKWLGPSPKTLWKKISDGLGDELADHLDDDPALVVH